MTLTRLGVDRDVLPTALLPAARSHMRVEFDRDDELIKLHVAASIDYVERVTGRLLNPVRFRWTPDGGTLSLSVNSGNFIAPITGFPDRSAALWGCGCDALSSRVGGLPALGPLSAVRVAEMETGDDVTPAFVLEGGPDRGY
jgi:hypothetical protein